MKKINCFEIFLPSAKNVFFLIFFNLCSKFKFVFAGGPGVVRPWHRVRAAWRGARVPPRWPGGHRAGRHRWKGKTNDNNKFCSDGKLRNKISKEERRMLLQRLAISGAVIPVAHSLARQQQKYNICHRARDREKERHILGNMCANPLMLFLLR